MKYIKKKQEKKFKNLLFLPVAVIKSTSTYVRIILVKIFNVFSKLGQMPEDRKSAAQHIFQ